MPLSDLDLDRAPIAPAGSLGGVPLIDLSSPAPDVVEAVGQACRDWGFFQIVGHGVASELTEEVLTTARRFFALPRDEKRLHSRTRDNPWGYYDRELTKEQRDKKEIFDIGPEQESVGDGPFAGATPWPDLPADFAPAMRRWGAEMERLSNDLIGLIGASLTGRADALDSAFEPGHTSFLRLNHYPVDDELAAELGGPAGLGIHHHTDAGALTVLLQDGVGGLQVYRDGAWHDVTPVANAFTINIGDMVQVWSNGLYPAPIHRVLAMQQSDRISIPYFCNPSYAAVVAPLVGSPHYAPIPWAEFRRRRAEGDFADYGTEVQISEWWIAAA
ncbi:MAG: 2OG-Fe(II) oxygenase family protein [Sphingomicrobium sp.]